MAKGLKAFLGDGSSDQPETAGADTVQVSGAVLVRRNELDPRAKVIRYSNYE